MERRLVDVWRQGDFTQRNVNREFILMFNEHLLYTSKRGKTKVQVGTMSPLPHYQKRCSSRAAYTDSKNVGKRRILSVDLNLNRIRPDRPESVHTDPAHGWFSRIRSDRPQSVHTDLAHGWFSRFIQPMLSLILNTPPQAQLEALRAFGFGPSRLHASSASLP
jgi:hypothetical protein